jgi:hypothetical protein
MANTCDGPQQPEVPPIIVDSGPITSAHIPSPDDYQLWRLYVVSCKLLCLNLKYAEVRHQKSMHTLER